MNTIADRPSARVETKGPTVTAGESLAAAVGLEVPLAQLCAMDRLRRLRDKLLVLNSSDDEYNLTDQDEHDLLRLVEERMAGGWRSMESAPKDGTAFQAWLRGDNWPGEWWESRCRFNDDGAFQVWQRVDYDDDGWDTVHATPLAWQPLPAPPAVKGV